MAVQFNSSTVVRVASTHPVVILVLFLVPPYRVTLEPPGPTPRKFAFPSRRRKTKNHSFQRFWVGLTCDVGSFPEYPEKKPGKDSSRAPHAMAVVELREKRGKSLIEDLTGTIHALTLRYLEVALRRRTWKRGIFTGRVLARHYRRTRLQPLQPEIC